MKGYRGAIVRDSIIVIVVWLVDNGVHAKGGISLSTTTTNRHLEPDETKHKKKFNSTRDFLSVSIKKL